MYEAENTFEEDWRQAVENVEVAPPSHVWVAIDRDLANDEALVYKREAIIYRWVAAACFLILSLGGMFYWFGSNAIDENTIAIQEENMNRMDELNESTSSIGLFEEEKEKSPQVGSVTHKNDRENKQLMTTAMKSNEEMPMNIYSDESSSVEKVIRSEFTALTPKSTTLKSNMFPWETGHLYAVARTWETMKEPKESSPIWAGLSMSTGSFDPGFNGGTGGDLSFAMQEDFLAESAVLPRQSAIPMYSAGQSFAGGFNLGKKVTERIQVSSGLHYSAFNTGSASSQIVTDSENNAYALANESSDENLSSELAAGNLNYAGEQVDLSNEYQYLTIPIKAGYVILDKKFNITLNTGLAGNILVNSNLKAESVSEELNNDFSTKNQYQNVYFNLLTSVEFGYLLKDHYQIVVEPNFNQALTEFTNANHSNQAKPRNLGVSVGFRYNF